MRGALTDGTRHRPGCAMPLYFLSLLHVLLELPLDLRTLVAVTGRFALA